MNTNFEHCFFSQMRRTLAIAGLVSASPILAYAGSAEQENPSWYVQGTLGAWAPQKHSMYVDLGGPVFITGQAQYSSDYSGALAFGRQSWTEFKEGSPIPVRLEVEGWHGSGKRRSIELGVMQFRPDDSLRVNALFVNGWLRLHRSQVLNVQRQPLWSLWLGAGAGYASLKYPQTAVLAGCNCLRAATQNGVTWQMKLSLERQMSESTQLVVQLGQVYLPAAKASGDLVPQAAYARLQGPTMSLGMRMDLR